MSPPIASPVSSTPAMPSMTTIPEADNKIERKYPVSERFNTLLPYECNPLQTIEPLIADGLSWSFDTSQFTKAQFVRIEGTAIFTGYFWPFTKDHDKFDALLKMIIHFFVADDHDETVYGHIDRDADKAAAILGQLYAVCDKLEGKDAGGRHVSAIRWKPYILAAYAVYNEIYLALNEVQKRRFLHVFREWNEGMIEECYDLKAKRKFNNLDEYIEVRGKSIATMPLLHLIEYADNLYVPEPEWNHPSMQALFAHLNRALIICNDMYSFEKELLDAGGRPDGVYNIVAANADIEGISLTESMDRLVAENERAEEAALVVCREIESADWPSADTRLFARRCLYIIGGHWKVCTFLDRYNEMLKLEPFLDLNNNKEH